MMSDAAFRELNSRHQVSRAYFFGQRDFMKQCSVELPIGLCAGLVHVWWAELRKGNDAIRCIQMATPELVKEVLISQARSFYLREFPPSDRPLRTPESELLKFKYGEHSIAAIASLFDLFGVADFLELDLVLLHNLPILKRWQCSHLALEIVNAIIGWARPGLYVLLIRFRYSQRPSGEGGHRCALIIEASGKCRYYDPRWGEMTFAALQQFSGWFTDYWTRERWDFFTQRVAPSSPPVRLFAFGGALSPTASEKSLALGRRFSASEVDVEEPGNWFAGLPFLQ